MEKKIYVTDKAKAHLRKVFGCTNMMVWKALSFKSDSDLAKKIRFFALKQLGGVANWKAEEMETTHEEGNRSMTQKFGERVKLVYDRSDGSCHVFVDDKESRKVKVVSISEFMSLQNEVGLMAMSL